MSLRISILCIWFFVVHLQAQDYSEQWESLYSYQYISDIAANPSQLYVASENAYFTYNSATNTQNKITTVNGLYGSNLSAIHYSENYQLTILGYETGLIEIKFDTSNDILTLVDILEKQTILPNNKSINHFNEYENKIYIATDYGITVFNLDNLEFGDTYYVGVLGSQIRVKATQIYNNAIYAACLDNEGVKKADLNNPNLIDYAEWNKIINGNYLALQVNNNQLYVSRTNKRIYEIVNDQLVLKQSYPQNITVLKSNTNYLIATQKYAVYVYDTNFNLVAEINTNSETLNTQFITAIADEEYIYIGTKDIGFLQFLLQDTSTFETISPEGPSSNSAFKIKAIENNLWITYGDYSYGYNPWPLRNRGISHLQGDSWKNISKDSVLAARNLSTIAINPLNTNQVFISSCIDGVLEINDDVATTLFTDENSTLISRTDAYRDIRQVASVFTNDGVLWTTTGRNLQPISSYNPASNQWNSYELPELVNTTDDEFGFSSIILDQNGTKWLGSYKNGVVAINQNITEVKSIYSENQNMPSVNVTALALDKNNLLWIGTNKGLRVLYNTNTIFTDANTTVENIVVLEDGIPSEVLYEQYITGIEVDGANNKWISTYAGLFYFTTDAEETIYHFTQANSPLPTNQILDISLEPSSGKLYVATDKGVVAYTTGSTSPTLTLSEAHVYPNPVRPNFNINQEKVKIKDFSENVNVKITDIEGNLVAEAASNTNLRYRGYNLEIDGGIAYWNGKNLANNTVASGVYLIMIYDLDTFETKVLKLMLIR